MVSIFNLMRVVERRCAFDMRRYVCYSHHVDYAEVSELMPYIALKEGIARAHYRYV